MSKREDVLKSRPPVRMNDVLQNELNKIDTYPRHSPTPLGERTRTNRVEVN